MTQADVIIDGAAAALQRSNEPHYAQDGTAISRARRAEMLTLVTSSIAHRDLVPMIERATQLGAGRDALARAYVSRASRQHVTSLDLGALFRGGT